MKKSTKKDERRDQPRFQVIECGMLWSKNGKGPERVSPVFITNVSIGGVQLKTRTPVDESGDLYLELGSEEGPIYLPGDMRYCKQVDGEDSVHTIGFKFAPESRREREAVAMYVLSLRERVCAPMLDRT